MSNKGPFLLDSASDAPFPPAELALQEPDGLLAVGGDLSPVRLLNAYAGGIFPWFSEGQPLLWWSPDPRTVFATDGVRLSSRLKNHPVCLASEGGVSIEMEKVLSKQPGSEGVKSDKVLELNANHPVFAVLKAAQEAGDTDKINKYAELLYDQALLIEGLPLEDPVAYAQLVCDLMK